MEALRSIRFGIARNTGIFSKLRHYMSLAQLKQLSYSIVHPFISYASLAGESGFKTQIKKVQTKNSNKNNIVLPLLVERILKVLFLL